MTNIILMTFDQLYETYLPTKLEGEKVSDYLKRLNELKIQFKRDLSLAYNLDGEAVNSIYNKYRFWGLERIKQEVIKETNFV